MYIVSEDKMGVADSKIPYGELDSVEIERSCCCFSKVNEFQPGWCGYGKNAGNCGGHSGETEGTLREIANTDPPKDNRSRERLRENCRKRPQPRRGVARLKMDQSAFCGHSKQKKTQF